MTCTRWSTSATSARGRKVLPQLGANAGEIEPHGLDDAGHRSSASGAQRGRLPVHGGHDPDGHRAGRGGGGARGGRVDIEVTEAPAELPLLQIGRRPAGLRGPGDDRNSRDAGAYRASPFREAARTAGRPSAARQVHVFCRNRWRRVSWRFSVPPGAGGPRPRRGRQRRTLRDVQRGPHRPARAPGGHREALDSLAAARATCFSPTRGRPEAGTGRARASLPRPGPAADRRGLERAADPGRDGLLLLQLGAGPGGGRVTRARAARPSASSTWRPGTGSPPRTRCSRRWRPTWRPSS